MLAAYAEQLSLPDYFGWNWDALEECLRDLSWLPPDRPVVVLHRGLPLRARGGARATYVRLLGEVAQFWQGQSTGRLRVVFPRAMEPAVRCALVASLMPRTDSPLGRVHVASAVAGIAARCEKLALTGFFPASIYAGLVCRFSNGTSFRWFFATFVDRVWLNANDARPDGDLSGSSQRSVPSGKARKPKIRARRLGMAPA